MTVVGVPIITKHGTKSTQHIYKVYPTKYTRMVHAKKAWQLHTHMNLVNIFPKQNKKSINKGYQHINFSSSIFLVLDWTGYQWEVEVQLSWILHCLQLGCLKMYPWLPASTSTSTILINKPPIDNQN